MPHNKVISLIEWAVIAFTCFTDIVLSSSTGIPLSSPLSSIRIIAIFCMIWALSILLKRMTGYSKGIENIAENIVKYFFILIAGSILEYYIAASPAPLRDAQMVAVDRSLGFDWQLFYDWVNSHPVISAALTCCYDSLHVQAALLLLVIGALYPRRGSLFVTACFIAVAITLFLFGIFPAAGPFVYYHHTDLPQAYYTEHYLKMRDHALTGIPMDDLRGIVSFPSLHVAGAVIMTYFFRGLSFLFAFFIILNIGMATGSLVIGGHYLVDVLGGCAVGAIALYAVDWLDKNDPERHTG